MIKRITNNESRTTNHESRTTNHESRTTNHESRTTNHESRTTIGYTLIEILFAVIILAILAGIAIPRLSVDFTVKMKVKTEAQRLVSDLRLTRRLAITNNENYKLSVNSSTNEYRIYDSGNTQTGITRNIDSSITISADKDFIFEKLGNASSSSDTAVSFSADGIQWNVTITAATGMVKMEE